MNKPLGTDWERIDALTDEQIDTSDSPALTEAFQKRAQVRLPKRIVTTTITIDAEVLEWFQAQGENYQARMHAALRLYAEAHKAAHA